jgi:hypothetical protein
MWSLIAAACLMFHGEAARADVAGPTDAPVARLASNLQKMLEAKPEDADLHYRLARVYTMALYANSDSIRAYEMGGPPTAAEKDLQIRKQAGGLAEEARKAYLKDAVEHFNRAIALDSKHAEYFLGLAWLLETSLEFAGTVDINPAPAPPTDPTFAQQARFGEMVSKLPDDKTATRVRGLIGADCGLMHGLSGLPASRLLVDALLAARSDSDAKRRDAVVDLLKADWRAQAENRYFQAFARTLEADSYTTIQETFNGVRSGINYEAASAYVKMVDKRGPTKCDGVRYAVAQAALKAYDKLPMGGAVSPIIFPIDAAVPLASLTSGAGQVAFDLDGTGRPQAYQWIGPNTGILVWDPNRVGKITSGRQLFGNVSWWVIFGNGYQALDALDDNRDGELTGSELEGIAVWVDRNGNGISDPGEVVPVEQLGIRAIRVRATSTEDGCPANREGIVMADGRVLPTYDWIATPVAVDSKDTRLISAAKGGPTP